MKRSRKEWLLTAQEEIIKRIIRPKFPETNFPFDAAAIMSDTPAVCLKEIASNMSGGLSDEYDLSTIYNHVLADLGHLPKSCRTTKGICKECGFYFQVSKFQFNRVVEARGKVACPMCDSDMEQR